MANVQILFTVRVKIPMSIWEALLEEDRHYIEALSRRQAAGIVYREFDIEIADLNKIRHMMAENGKSVVFPEAKVMKQLGFRYSGDSMVIRYDSGTFIIKQYFPNGEIKTHTVSEKRVWKVYYTIRDMGGGRHQSREVWEALAKRFNMQQFFNEQGEFDKAKFNGSRKIYHNFFYYPVKVLEDMKKIGYEGKEIWLREKAII